MSQDNPAVNGIKTTGVVSVSAAVGDGGPSSGFYIFTGGTAGRVLKAPLHIHSDLHLWVL